MSFELKLTLGSECRKSQSKNSDILEIIKTISSFEYFLFIKDFLKYANDKNNDENLQKLESSANNLEVLLEQALFFLAPDQSNGVEVARASFNFYTINKTPKNLDEELEKNKKELNSIYNLLNNQVQFLKNINFLKYLEDKEKKLTEISMIELYEYLKEFRCKKKSEFLEMINQKKWSGKDVYNHIKTKFPLFNDKKEKIDLFLDLTEKITEAGNDNNKEKQRELKIKRGRMFMYNFPDYSKKYCNEIYKSVAMKVGNIKAKIRGIEQEKINAHLLKYWTQILKIGNKKVLVLIPKNTIHEVRKIIKNFILKKSDVSLISFNSLTLRALDKLIRKNFPREIPEMNKSDENKIKLYQRILKENLEDKKNKIDLDFTGYNLNSLEKIIEQDFSDLESFRIDLEKITYSLQEFFVSDECINKLKKIGVIFSQITSYDLERNIVSDIKDHTLLWNDFWDVKNQKNNFSTRLNPELKIMYRKKREQSKEKQNNRFSKESLLVNFTITENSAQKEMKTAFTKPEDVQKKIEQFNREIIIENFIKEKGEKLYYFGIDRGNQELATLSVAKWTKKEYEATLANGEVKKFKKPEFPEILVYKIKNLMAEKEIIIDKKGNKKLVKISQNPSYFMENEDEIFKYFLEKKVAFIDLTIAKLIKGRIVLNGDVQTYINLKKANAKRKLFDIFSKINSDSNVEFCDEKHEAWSENVNGKNIFQNSFLIKLKEGERGQYQVLCYFLEDQKNVLSRNKIKEDLQEYLKKLRQDISQENISIEQINHLRDAITANMIGIIALLFEQYPAIINLENLHKDRDIQRHFFSNNENIARRLEWALYRKFQKIGLVPPNIRQTILLKDRKENPINQFGIIHFVKTENTSGDCPFCEENVSMKQRQEDKFKEHAYVCHNEKCKFNTKNPLTPFEAIDNSDSVAAYNIAKRGSKFILKTT